MRRIAGRAWSRWRCLPARRWLNAFITNHDQMKRSWYAFYFQHWLADTAVAADDMALIDTIWRDWSPGYDGTADIEAVKDSIRDPANLAAAIGYYRAALNGVGVRDDLAAVQEATGAIPTQPTLYLHGGADGCIGAEVAEVRTGRRRSERHDRHRSRRRPFPPSRVTRRDRRPHPGVPHMTVPHRTAAPRRHRRRGQARMRDLPDGRPGPRRNSPRRSSCTSTPRTTPTSPPTPRAIPDSDLAVSWFHDIETVPTVIRCADGVEIERTVGWSRDGVGGTDRRRRARRRPATDAPRLRIDVGRPRSGRRTAGAVRPLDAVVASRRGRDRRGRVRDDVRPRLDRRPPGDPADRGTRDGDARRDDPSTVRHRRPGAARPRRGHRREDRRSPR